MMVFMRGGEDVSGATLTRFFGLHIAILPALCIGTVIAHLMLVQKVGACVPASSEKEWEQHPERRKEMRFFPNFFLRELLGWYAVLGLLIVLAVFFPWELGVKADPFSPAPPGIKPEWYFLAQFQTLKLIPAKVFHIDGEVLGILGFGLGGAVWLGLPFIEALLGARGS